MAGQELLLQRPVGWARAYRPAWLLIIPRPAHPEDVAVDTSLHSLAKLAARVLLMLLFLVSGLGKLSDPAATQGYMAAMGLPGILLWPTILFEIGTALCILLGFQTRAVAAVLAAFSLVTAFIFHHQLADPVQQIMFLKNLAIAGGFLLLACSGPGRFSVDARRGKP
ncbi:DoxX family protein [Stenotrophomonas indicatrix]|jgi:putative oxidoreductase|nr:DoxX family protein [Stenotrophomonas indicatrix]